MRLSALAINGLCSGERILSASSKVCCAECSPNLKIGSLSFNTLKTSAKESTPPSDKARVTFS